MTANSEQAEYWSSAPGLKWIRFEEDLDAVFGSVTNELIRRARPRPGERLLDIGCGTGAASVAFAGHLAPAGTVTALDISEPLLKHAKSRANEMSIKSRYCLLDAQNDAIPTAPFDLVISRFGVMFFSNPVAAFANIRRHMCQKGRLVVAAWAPMNSENPWFEIPFQAAMSHLGPPDPEEPNAPGPLGFQDISYVVDVLQDAGFSDVAGDVAEITFEHSGPLKKVSDLAANIGPAARILKKYNGTAADVEAIQEAVLKGFRRFEKPEGVRIPAKLNFFEAVNTG